MCVLKGAFMFVADLVRAIDLPVEVDFMAISSYGSGTQTSGIVRIVKDLEISIEGRAVIVVEDIVDSGLTLSYLLKSLQARRPRSLAICALLTKPERREVDVPVTYIGFEIPNKFVVGYGLDVNERFRNLREIGVVEPPGTTDSASRSRYPEAVRTTHVGACPLDCPDTCSWVLEAEDGRVVSIRGNKAQPFTHGALCGKVNRYLDHLNGDRLLHPMVRTGAKGEGRFARVGWDEALDRVADGLRQTIDRHGPEAILPFFFAGSMGMIQSFGLPQRILYALGTSRLETTICTAAWRAAAKATIGGQVCIDPGDPAGVAADRDLGREPALDRHAHLEVRQRGARRRRPRGLHRPAALADRRALRRAPRAAARAPTPRSRSG